MLGYWFVFWWDHVSVASVEIAMTYMLISYLMSRFKLFKVWLGDTYYSQISYKPNFILLICFTCNVKFLFFHCRLYCFSTPFLTFVLGFLVIIEWCTYGMHSDVQVNKEVRHSVVRVLDNDVPYSWNLCYL